MTTPSKGGSIRRYKKNKGHESINRDMLQDEDNLSIAAIGLLSNMLSYPDNWVLYKTQLYKRFKKSGRKRILSAWNELVEQKYIVQLIARNGKSYDYIYYFQDERFTDSEIAQICEDESAKIWDGSTPSSVKSGDSKIYKEQEEKNISGVQNGQPKMSSPKRTPNKSTNHHNHHQDKPLDTSKDTDKRPSEEIENDKLDELGKRNLRHHLPDNIFQTLNTFSTSYEQMHRWIGVLFRAKKAVSEDWKIVITLEDHAEIIDDILARAIHKIRTDHTIAKPDDYLYATIENELHTYIAENDRKSIDDDSLNDD